MKNILTIFLCLLLATATQAQNTQTKAPCPEYYKAYMEQAAAAFAKGDFTTAIDKYSSALAICPQNVAIVKPKMIEVFNRINQLKQQAEKEKAKKAELQTKTALTETQKQKQIATENLAKANKLVNAFYFYEGRFALAFKDYKFYFIDKNGDKVEKLGKWDKAEQFDDKTGFAYIKKDGKDHILDTLGNTYRVAYNLASMDSSVVALDLSDVQLDSFPTLVLQHTQLEVLILNGGYNKEKNFKTLPTEIAKLQNLKNLQLNYCQIDSLAPQIGELKNLTTLELSGNKFTSLPAQIGELKNLTTLDLSSNSLTSLPAQIGELKNLTELDLYGSQFTSLPAQIGELKNLTELDLYGSQLTSLPPQIGELKNLTTLDLSYNDSLDLASVCMAFAKYPKKIIISSDIRVSNNDTSTLLIKFNTELTSLPVQIGELKNLTTLNLQDNSLTSLPAQIGELKNLNKLYLSSNQLTSLPAQIGELKNLNKLYLGGNQFTSLPTQIGKLKNLTVLDLERNQLRSLPTQIGELKNLTELNLIGNLLQSLPPSFFTWKVSKTMEYDELVKSAADSANFAFAQQIYEGIKDKKELPNTNYGDLSWWFVFAHCFEGAIWAGERYVAGGGKEIGQFSNLAMGYLYNGEYEKAKAIYAEYKNEKDSYDRTGKEIFLKDLRAVAAAKVPAKNPADVEKMMRFLEE